jgi:hypothetical protein
MLKLEKTAEPGSTRDLAYRLMRAFVSGSADLMQTGDLLHEDCRFHLPRSATGYTGGHGHDTPPTKLTEAIQAANAKLDFAKARVTRTVYDIFQGDRGGIQFFVLLAPRGADPYELQVTATFERRDDKLAAVWLHADTAMIRMMLEPGWRQGLEG